MKMPVFFVGHGSPMNIISNNNFTQSLENTAKLIAKPDAIVVVSAHWLTNGTLVTGSKQPETIYDFYGFPSELYKTKYPCPGSPALAEKIKNAFPEQISISTDYGLDHAVWSVLKHMYPNADIPVIALSLDITKPYRMHFEISKKLKFLREQNVLIIASGNIVHNLRHIDFSSLDAPVFEWAANFQKFIEKALEERNTEVILDPFRFSETAKIAIPTNDHYLPLVYFIGLLEKNEKIKITHNSIQHGSISMLCCISE